jgi:hypothetical protein
MNERMLRRLVRQAEPYDMQQEWGHINTCISERAQGALKQERWKRN